MRVGDVLRWIVLVLSPATTWPVVSWLHVEAPPPSVMRFESAKLSPKAGKEPPQTVAWREVRLPHRWHEDGRGEREVWYRLSFGVDRPVDRRWAVYLPSVAMNAAVVLNGHSLGDGGRFRDLVARHWNRPLFFPFTARLLVPGENVLHVRVRSDGLTGGFLSHVDVGPEDLVGAIHQRRRRLKVTSVTMIGVAAGLMALFAGWVWIGRRSEAHHGWYAVGMSCLALTHFHVLVTEPPVATALWMWPFYAALGWLLIASVLAFLDLVGEGHDRLRRALLAYGVAGSAVILVLALLDPIWFQRIAAGIWIALPFLAVPYAIARVVDAVRRSSDRQLAILLAATSGVAWCGFHDWLVVNDLVAPENGFFLPYAVPFVILSWGWLLVYRFAQALKHSEALVVELEKRVEQKREELQRSNERVREMDRTRIVAQERERVMREMHDGLGSHLVSTLALIEHSGADRDAVAEALHGTLDEMRLMTESLEPIDGDVVTALGRLRTHLQPRLEAAHIRVDWQVEDSPAVTDLGPRAVLQLLRILQEALTNVLKHSGARSVRVRTAGSEVRPGVPGILVEVADDGRGFAGEPSGGHGIRNMRGRAEEIGARLEVTSSVEGTTVRLLI